jgi:hypothetical protein
VTFAVSLSQLLLAVVFAVAGIAKLADPAGGGPAGANNDGCEPGFTFCTDHCCDLSNAYCQSCPEKLICCRQGENCCPSG